MHKHDLTDEKIQTNADYRCLWIALARLLGSCHIRSRLLHVCRALGVRTNQVTCRRLGDLREAHLNKQQNLSLAPIEWQ
jgi:hypothetical protein